MRNSSARTSRPFSPPSSVPAAALKRIRENLAIALLYNLIAVPLAVGGMVTPLVAALAMSGSSILVTVNALRARLPARLRQTGEASR